MILLSEDKIAIFGKNIETNRNEILRQIGAIIEKPDLYKYLTALQNIQIMARLSGIKLSKQELMLELERVGIGSRAQSKVKTFSQGMKQRLGIACALIHHPRLIILDEPTNGLDPQGIADVRSLILHLSKEEGKTLFVSSHLLNEIELVADSMLIIDKGRKIAEGKVSELLNPADTLVAVETVDDAATIKALSESQWNQFLQSGYEQIILKIHRQDIPELNRFFVFKNINVLSLQPKHSLEDYFLNLTTSNQHVADYKD